MKNKNIAIICFFIFSIIFTSCWIEEGHAEYKISFSENECKRQYELWKSNRPKSYSFIYIADSPGSMGPYEWRGKVTVSDNKNVVQFLYRFGDIKEIEEDSVYAKTVPEENDINYIDSIDDLFEEILNQYNIYKSNFDNEKYWSAEYSVDYNSKNYYPEKVNLSIRYERPLTGVKGDADDIYFNVMITDFTVLE